MHKNKIIFNFISLFLLVFLIGCASSSLTTTNTDNVKVNIREYENENLPISFLCPSPISWNPLIIDGQEVEGFSIIQHKIKELKASWTCVKVSLDTEGLEIVASLNKEDLNLPPRLTHVKSFAKENNAIIALNATPWGYKDYPTSAVGIVKIDGIQYFPPSTKYAALTFSENPLRAHIYQNQNKEEIDKYDWAFGGFYQVLKNSEVLTFNKTRRSRLAVGTNEDGSDFFIFAISSSFLPKDSSGFTYEECALVLKQLGCTDAMQFDGGHSTCLVVNKKDFQKPLLNRKIPIAIGLKK